MPDFSVLIIHVINIAVLFTILRALLYKPVKSFMDGRKSRIEGELQLAQTMQLEASAITSQAQTILDNARNESRNLINEGAKKAKEDADAILHLTEEKAREITRQARIDAQSEKEAYIRGVHDQIGDLALEIAEQILRRELTEKDNTAIIESFFNEKETQEHFKENLI